MTERMRLQAETVALRRQLNEQWDYNHAEHCGCEDPDGARCNWPLPVLLGGDPDQYRPYQDEQATRPRFPIDDEAHTSPTHEPPEGADKQGDSA